MEFHTLRMTVVMNEAGRSAGSLVPPVIPRPTRNVPAVLLGPLEGLYYAKFTFQKGC